MAVGQVGKLYVEIDANSKPLMKSLRESEAAIQGVGKNMQSNFNEAAEKVGKGSSCFFLPSQTIWAYGGYRVTAR
ncbi:MAG: hypothetical protein ACOYJB_00700 [Christensenellaceae bacterium]|jgi:hypothetical protein